jgi:hypothetical protein
MKTYKITVKEHEEYGGLGLVVDVGRPYFDPLRGLGIAHDILEHPVTPHPNPVVDELMAIGGIVAGRLECGWSSPGGYRMLDLDDIAMDVSRMAVSCCYNGNAFCSLPCNSYIQDKKIVELMRKGIEQGIKQAEHEVEGTITIDIGSSVAWVCKGYQAYIRRFKKLDNYTISTHLFDKIASVADEFLNCADEGQTAYLCVDFSRYDCWLKEEPFS